jgi:hypothetical protein
MQPLHLRAEVDGRTVSPGYVSSTAGSRPTRWYRRIGTSTVRAGRDSGNRSGGAKAAVTAVQTATNRPTTRTPE